MEKEDFVRARILVAKWNLDFMLDLAIKEIKQRGVISRETKDLWLCVKREYLRVQHNVPNKTLYKFDLFSFMTLEDETSEDSQENETSQESIHLVYRRLVDSTEWNDDDLDSLDRFDHLLRQQTVKKCYIKNGVDHAKKIFEQLWKSEPKAKYAAIKKSLKDLISGKTEPDVDDELSFGTEALNTLEILASKLERPYLHEVVAQVWKKVKSHVPVLEGETRQKLPKSGNMPKDMHLTVSGSTLFKTIKQLSNGKQGKPLYLSKNLLPKLQGRRSHFKRCKDDFMKDLPKYFPDYQHGAESSEELDEESSSSESSDDEEVSIPNKNNMSRGKQSVKSKEKTPTPAKVTSSTHSDTPTSLPRKAAMSSGKRKLLSKRKLHLQSDGRSDEDSESDAPPSVKKTCSNNGSKSIRSPRRQGRNKWTPGEEDLLCRGVAKYGPGRWVEILQYTRIQRTNVDLKDKWRQLLKNGRAKGIAKKLGIKLDFN